MKITIEIECEEPQEVYSHLSTIQKSIKKRFNRIDWDNFHHEQGTLPEIIIADNNCYGTHTCTINLND